MLKYLEKKINTYNKIKIKRKYKIFKLNFNIFESNSLYIDYIIKIKIFN